jgi:cystathionine beta-lyase
MTDSDDQQDHKPETQVGHLGRKSKNHYGFINTPLYRGSTVLFETAEKLFAYDHPYPYAISGSPTQDSLREAICELEGAEGTCLTPSGLNAITTALLAFLKTGDHLLMTDSVYRPTRRFCDSLLKNFGIETTYYDPMIGADIAELFQANTKVVFTEAPGSQTMEMQDIPAIVAAAKTNDILVMIDNTWATPIYFRPLEHGVDISIVAVTKFIGGHSDLMMGTIAANKTHWQQLHQAYERLGLYVGPDDIALALRGMRTLPLRLERHMASGLTIAKWLQQRPEVSSILYPVLEDDPGHALWKRDFDGAPGLFSALLHPVDLDKLKAFLDALKLFGMGYSWGGFESLVIPFDPTSYRSATTWTHDGPALRFHIGLEDPGDLMADLEVGFAAMAL